MACAKNTQVVTGQRLHLLASMLPRQPQHALHEHQRQPVESAQQLLLLPLLASGALGALGTLLLAELPLQRGGQLHGGVFDHLHLVFVRRRLRPPRAAAAARAAVTARAAARVPSSAAIAAERL
jgi:hypothetical protein